MIDAGLDADLDRAARAGSLLVAMDFDGTLSELVDVAAEARPVAGAVAALHRLAALPGTAVALISGRAVADLSTVSGVGDTVELIGSHGAERGRHADATPIGTMLDELRSATAALEQRTGRTGGATIERKPAAVVVHYRQVADEDRPVLLADVARIAAEHPALVVAEGKCVVELSAHAANKGQALRALRADVGADMVLFAGDDFTDEHVFAMLEPADIGIKVGAGATRAARRLGRPAEVVAVLEALADRRHPGG